MRPTYAIVFLFLFSFVLRAIIGLHGAPYCYHNDEHWIFEPAFFMASNHTWDLHWFRVPPFLIILYRFLITGLEFLIPTDLALPDAAVDHWFDPQSILPQQFPILYAGRLLVAFFGSATVILIYATLKQYIDGKKAFLFSFLYSILSVVVFYSSFLRPEPLVVFFLVMSIYCLSRFQFSSKKQWIVAAGISFGLACGTKYNACFFIFSAFLFILFFKTTWIDYCKNCGIYVLGAVIGFVFSDPYIFWKSSQISSDAKADLATYLTGQAGNKGSHLENFFYYVQNLYTAGKFSFLFWILVFSVVFFPLLRKKMDKQKYPLFATSVFFCVSYTIFLCLFHYRAERNLIFIHPFILITAAILFSHLLGISKKWVRIPTLIFLICGILVSILYSDISLSKYNHPLPQDSVNQWIQQNAPKGSTIVREFESPLIDPHTYRVHYAFSASIITPQALLKLDPKYLILSAFIFDIKNEYKNSYPLKFSQWIWSKKPDYENINPENIPFGTYLRVYDFQKYKKEYLTTFRNDLVLPKGT